MTANDSTGPAQGETQAPGTRWRAILRHQEAQAFAVAFHADVVLETALFDGHTEGPAALQIFFNATRGLYEEIHFVRETASAESTVLEWEGAAFGGRVVTGVTILDHDTNGTITRVRLFHRPYAMVLDCAETLARSLAGQLGPGVRWLSGSRS